MAPAEQAKTGGFRHECRMCGRLFATHELNVEHMLGHLRGYLCMQCGGRFYRGPDLLGHIAHCQAADTEADEAKPQPPQPLPAKLDQTNHKSKPRRRQPRPKCKSQIREPVRFIEQIDLVSESDSGHEGDADADDSPAGWPATSGGSGDEDLVPATREPAQAFEVIAEAADEAVANSQEASSACDPLKEAPEAGWRLRRHSDSVVKTMEKPELPAKKIVAWRLSCPGTLCKCPPNLQESEAPVTSNRPGPASRKRRLGAALEPPCVEPSEFPARASAVSVQVKEAPQLQPRRRQGQRERQTE